MSNLKRAQLQQAAILNRINRKIQKATGPQQASMVNVSTVVYGDEQPGGAPTPGTPDSGTINQSCADNATTNITIGAVLEIAAIHITYQCTTGAYYEGGSAVLFTDGTNANCSVGARSYLGSGYCLDDDAPLDGDVNGGILRLKVTTKSLGGACDFRATYLTVEA